MKTFKQQLIEKPKDFTNGEDFMATFFSEHINKFCLEFNCKLFTFKTWNGFVNKRNTLIEKWSMIEA